MPNVQLRYIGHFGRNESFHVTAEVPCYGGETETYELFIVPDPQRKRVKVYKDEGNMKKIANSMLGTMDTTDFRIMYS